MAKKGRRELSPCCKTYGFPIYCAAWAPLHHITASDHGNQDPQPEETHQAAVAPQIIAVLGGGGGEGHSGIPNALLLSRFDIPSRSLSDQPVCRLETESDVPYRMALHPGGDGIICSFPKSSRWFEWNLLESKEILMLALKPSEQKLSQLEDVGLQLALAFNVEGSILATGGEDGHLRVFKWPNMEIILDQSDAHTSIKDLDFSSDSKFLVSSGNSGPCRVWDLTSSKVAASLPREAGDIFGFCKFSRGKDNDQVLYITVMHGEEGQIVSWNTQTWKRTGAKKIVRDAISAFSVSVDGKFLAVGTVEGDVVIVNSSNMAVHENVREAHLGIVTALVFSQDSRVLLSTSFDSTAHVTVIEDKKSIGFFNMWVIMLTIVLAILIYNYFDIVLRVALRIFSIRNFL